MLLVIIVQLKTTSPDAYQVTPHRGIIEPGDVANITVKCILGMCKQSYTPASHALLSFFVAFPICFLYNALYGTLFSVRIPAWEYDSYGICKYLSRLSLSLCVFLLCRVVLLLSYGIVGKPSASVYSSHWLNGCKRSSGTVS